MNGKLWIVAGVAVGLFVVQTALADSDVVTVRLLINTVGIGAAALVLTRIGGQGVPGPAPEPVSLVLAGLAAVSMWGGAWWVMDLTNNALTHVTGPIPHPQAITLLSDRLAGVNLQPAAYELYVLFTVVLIPLVTAWLLWGQLQPALGALVGRWRAAWITGITGGAFITLTAVQEIAAPVSMRLLEVDTSRLLVVQNIAPVVPWGLAALGGYVLLGCAAALAVYLTGSAWAGFVVHGTYIYANFALLEDLLKQLGGKAYWHVGWLTVILLGGFGVVILFQAIRYRSPRPPAPERIPANLMLQVALPLAALLAALIVMAVLDLAAR